MITLVIIIRCCRFVLLGTMRISMCELSNDVCLCGFAFRMSGFMSWSFGSF
jgi:hypothetical protein